ncbi:uncharacterized protein LOC129588899 [Paramacrobiotus metropolitanus]|uniref:uncharacterized protein LOC129588899 n=1 Tax=Paramacrobiotus metropolitanus TaxID=2943436 RepID=UPI0024456F2D|nr:uncharacterized protein LOC129588899 [Paramacrobiotus metropolitanus]
MFTKDVWRYGALDVQDPTTGQIRHGLLVDLVAYSPTDVTLLVNFDHPLHHAVPIPYTQCVVPDPSVAKGNPPETLYQSSPNHPWRWYPCTVLVASPDYLYVEMGVEGARVRAVVRGERVRPRAGAAVTLLQQFCPFQRREVGLPRSGWLAGLPGRGGFWGVWKRVTGTIGVRVRAGKVIYIASGAEGMTPSECEAYLRRIGIILEENRPVPPTPFPESVESPSLAILPSEMIMEVFSHLPVDQAILSRRVCSHWDAALSAPTVSSHLRVDVSRCGERQLAGLLQHCVTSATRVLHLKGHGPDAPLYTVLGMLAARGLTIPLIILDNLTVQAEELLDYSDPSILHLRAEWPRICRRSLWRDVRVTELLESQMFAEYRAQFTQYSAAVGQLHSVMYRFSAARLGVTLDLIPHAVLEFREPADAETVLSVLETACPPVDADWRITVEWTKRAQSAAGCEQMLRVFRKWQPNDPRLRSHPKPEVVIANLPLGTLRKLGQHALIYNFRGVT